MTDPIKKQDHFEDAWRRWLQLETDPRNPDAVTNDPADPGGPTRYGIAQKYHPEIDVAHISREDARRIIHDEYWVAFGVGRLRHKNLAIKVMTLGGFIGMARAVELLQTACNMLGADLAVDGLIGPKTAAWVNQFRHPGAIEEALETQATTWLLAKGRSKYIAGWLVRVDE